jgi:membrane-bound lytic murein transglycosylase MltF
MKISRLQIALVCVLFLLTSARPAVAGEALLQGSRFLEDFDQMLERRYIRVLVAYNKMLYFFDGADQRGITYDGFQEFEKYLNDKHKLGARKLHMVFIPVPRDQLIPLLVGGYGDIAAANLTITEERLKLVDFTDPWAEGVVELLVTGPAAPEVKTIEDLAGKAVHVRESSSYFESLTKLNADFAARGLEPVELVPADEYMEDGDLLEMVNAGLIPMVVVDSHKAEFWKDIFEELTVRSDIVLREGGAIAQAVRKNNPKLKSAVNEFLKNIKKGTMLGNVLHKRYLKGNKWVRNAYRPEDIEKFNKLIGVFEQYAAQFEFDWTLLIALGYQESRLDHSVRSPSGAVGIMQILPSTAKDPNVGISDIDKLENNIHAGTKYLRFLRDQYFSDSALDELNQTLFTFASYNAGPAKVAALREEAAKSGLDPDIWLGNVEVVCAKRIGAETTQYVSNIYKYYIAYKLIMQQRDRTAEAKQKIQSD